MPVAIWPAVANIDDGATEYNWPEADFHGTSKTFISGIARMRITRIKKIFVFDVAKTNNRGQLTRFSVEIDGATVYSKAILGYPILNSGANTVGAFKNERFDSLFAWIDPVSGEFFVTTDDGTFRPSMLVPGFILVAIAILMRRVGMWPDAPLVIFVVPVLLGALVAVVSKKFADRKLERLLRSAWNPQSL